MMGPPWTKDHRIALAATIMAGLNLVPGPEVRWYRLSVRPTIRPVVESAASRDLL
jgi:hypothetical protein